MALVEVVAAPTTDPSAAAAVTRVVTGWGKTPVRSADSPGFIVNRINRPFTLEALRMIDEGLTTASADRRGDQDHRLPDGPVRADGPHRARRQPRLDPGHLRGVRQRAALPAVADPRATRRRRDPRPQDRLGLLRLRRGRQEGSTSSPACRAATSPTSAWAASPSGSSTASSTRPTGRSATAWPREADIDTALKLGAGHPLGPFERAARLGGPASVVTALNRLAATYGPAFEPAPLLLKAIG